MNDLSELKPDEQRYVRLCHYSQKLSEANLTCKDDMHYLCQCPASEGSEDILAAVDEHSKAVRRVMNDMQVEQSQLLHYLSDLDTNHRSDAINEIAHHALLGKMSDKLKQSAWYVDTLLNEYKQSLKPVLMMQMGYQLRHHHAQVDDVTHDIEKEKKVMTHIHHFDEAKYQAYIQELNTPKQITQHDLNQGFSF